MDSDTGELDYSLLNRDIMDFFPAPINTGTTANSEAYLKVLHMVDKDLPTDCIRKVVSTRLNELDKVLILKIKIRNLS